MRAMTGKACWRGWALPVAWRLGGERKEARGLRIQSMWQAEPSVQ